MKLQIETIDLENIKEDTSLESAPMTFKRTARSTTSKKSSPFDPPSTQVPISASFIESLNFGNNNRMDKPPCAYSFQLILFLSLC